MPSVYTSWPGAPATGPVEFLILELCDHEKRRIGQDLHDGVGQLMTGISLKSKALEQRLRDAGYPEADEIKNLSIIADEVIRRVREVVAGLAPVAIQNQDAIAALQLLCRQIEDLHHIRCVFIPTQPALKINDPATVKHLYFIAEEAVHNAIRHGDADQIELRLRRGAGPRDAELIIRNNGSCTGSGFTEGVGLCSMRCRAKALNGTLAIEYYPGESVEVICSFGPVPGEHQEDEHARPLN